MTMIDAHQHFWQIGRHDCCWPTADTPQLYRDFGVADLVPLAQDLGVEGSVLVQSQASDKDTDYLLALARDEAFIKAVVGWVDLAAANAPQRIAQLATHKKLRGLRPMLQNLVDDRWIVKPELEPAIRAMQQHNLCLDALVFTRHLPHLTEFAELHPDLRLVIDHAAKPPVAAADKHLFGQWRDAIAPLAKLPWVYCKLSGLLTEANATQADDALRPYVEYLYHSFGAERLMWGSDWPVVCAAPNANYAAYLPWLNMAQQFMAGLEQKKIAQIFGETACEFYGF
jgi:L-fuconolactonase